MITLWGCVSNATWPTSFKHGLVRRHHRLVSGYLFNHTPVQGPNVLARFGGKDFNRMTALVARRLISHLGEFTLMVWKVSFKKEGTELSLVWR